MIKTSLTLTLAFGLLLGVGTMSSFAGNANKKVTITGTAMCAKCALHESTHCQTVIQTKKDGKTVTYWLTPNKTAKDFHPQICTDPEKVTATGTVAMKGGKETMTVASISASK